MDPFRLSIALVPLAAYLLLLALVNMRRRPFMTTGGCDLAALGVALSGWIFIGPIELFRPEAASAEFGNYVWLFLIVFYWLWISLAALLMRPRLVIYNVSLEELHPALAEAAAELDPQARWAGDSLTLPNLGLQLHLDGLPFMRNVTLASSGNQQSLDGWRRLARALGRHLDSLRVRPNPRSVGFLLLALLLMATSLSQMLNHPRELAQAMRQVFQY